MALSGSNKSITAILDIDISKFSRKIGTVENHLSTLTTRLNTASIGTNALSNTSNVAVNRLNGLQLKLDSISKSLQNTSNQSKNANNSLKTLGTGTDKIVTSTNNLSSSQTKTTTTTKTLSNEWARGGSTLTTLFANVDKTASAHQRLRDAQLRAFQRSTPLTAEFLKQGASSNTASVGLTRYARASESAAIAMGKLSASATGASAGITKAGTSATTASSQLSMMTGVMNSLKNITTIVASLFLYQFAYSMIQTVNTTIRAKSEMEALFRVLENMPESQFSSSDVNSFNKALDKTVKMFPKVNRYSLGETVTGLGVEFKLSAEEMEKAMPIVSMVTSEYLRAGRTVSEATLAVKDIFQGEFLRLSRETGVGLKDLQAAGYSGDKNDVVGLMEALDKIGRSRGWDLFAAKATSLNDVLLITQNRFSEFVADLSGRITPGILLAFNTLTTAVGYLGLAWRSLGGVGQSVVGWTGLATAIGVATLALVNYRTGANLVTMVQMGLRGSLVATVLGLNAETVAQYGSLTAIRARITGLSAENAANMSNRAAIVAKVLGLQAEAVASYGARAAIIANIAGVNAETAAKLANNTVTAVSAEAELALALSKRGNIALMATYVFGLNAELVARRGTLVALYARVAGSVLLAAGYNAEAVAAMTATGATRALTLAMLTNPVILFAAALAALAVVAGVTLYNAFKKGSKGIKEFNEMVENGDNITKKARDTQTRMEERVVTLTNELNKLEKGTAEYTAKQRELTEATKDAELAQKNYTLAYEAHQKAVSASKKLQDARDAADLRSGNARAESLKKYGVEGETANKRISDSYMLATEGIANATKATEMYVLETKKADEALESYNAKLYELGLRGDKLAEESDKYASLGDNLKDANDRKRTSTTMGDYIGASIDGWFFQFRRDWSEFWLDPWSGMGAINILQMIDVFNFKDFWRSIFGGTQLDGLGKDIGYLFNDVEWDKVLATSLPTLGSILSKWINKDKIVEFLRKEINFSKIFSDLFSGTDSTDGAKLDFSAMIGFDQLTADLQAWVDGLPAWWESSVMTPLRNTWTNFTTWFDTTIMLPIRNAWNGLVEWINTNLIIPLQTAWTNFWLWFDTTIMLPIRNAWTGLVEWINTTVILPLQTAWTNFTTWFDTNVVQPINKFLSDPSTAIGDWLQSIIDTILGKTEDGRSAADIFAQAIYDGIMEKLYEIPWIGPILEGLNKVEEQAPKGESAGKEVGDATNRGTTGGLKGIVDKMNEEFGINIPAAIRAAIPNVSAAAEAFGNAIIKGANKFPKIFSPGFLHDKFLGEFGTYIPQAITKSIPTVFEATKAYGQQIVDGFNPDIVSKVTEMMNAIQAQMQQQQAMSITAPTISSPVAPLDPTLNQNAMAQYQNDATLATQINTQTSNDTQTTFSGLSSILGSAYSTMGNTQKSSLTNMQNTQKSGMTNIQNTTQTSLNTMRNTTQSATTQMTQAWMYMKDQIVVAASDLRSQASGHFDTLSGNIGTFYRKIQNPANWGGSGVSRTTSTGIVNRTPSNTHKALNNVNGLVKSFTGRYAGGSSSSNEKLPMWKLVKQFYGNNNINTDHLLNGKNANQMMTVEEFLSGVNGYAGWGDWSSNHMSHIKRTSGEWDMRGPRIDLVGGIDTGMAFKVKEFDGARPTISFDTFRGIAEAIFDAIPYDQNMYFNSDKTGHWLTAMQTGSVNCYDGTLALLALAQTCGFSGSMAHGNWGDTGHVWAIINGMKMDTTAWQNGYGWDAPQSRGGTGPVRKAYGNTYGSRVGGETPNVTVNINFNGDVKDPEEIESKVKKGTMDAIKDIFGPSIHTG